MLDVHCVVNSRSALQDLGQLLRGRAWDHFGTTRYAPGRTTRTSPHPPHRPRMLADQAEHPRPTSWGSRGRRFKSGRPDGFFERLYPEVGTKTAMIIPT